MQYFISFLEGIITFVSPCLLPMIPIYISYFAGGTESVDAQKNTKVNIKTLKNAFGFVLGFTVVFICMGALAGTFGSFLKNYQQIVNLVSGIIVIIFGLSFLGVLKFNFFNGAGHNISNKSIGFISSFLFGIIFSIGWTPCVGVFLGSALALASQQGHVLDGILMLFTYSMGLGIPFIMSALLIDKLKSTFGWIKKNYSIINKVSGTFLVVIGVLMATGYLGKFLNLLS